MPGSGVGVGAFIFDEHGRAAVRNLDFRMQVECTKHRFQSCWSQIDLWLVTRFNFQWCGTCTLLLSAVFWDFPLSSRLAFVSQGSSFRDSQRMVCIFASFFFLQRSSSCEMMLSPLFSDDSNKVLLLKRSSSARTAPGTWARPPFQKHLLFFQSSCHFVKLQLIFRKRQNHKNVTCHWFKPLEHWHHWLMLMTSWTLLVQLPCWRSRFTAQAWWCCEFWRELWSRTCTRNQAGLGIQHWTTAGTAWKDLKHVQWCERMWHISVWNHWLYAFREETGLEICSPQLLDAPALHLDSLLLQLQRAAPIFVTDRGCYCFIASVFFQFCQSSSPRVWCWSKHISDIIRYISSWHLNVLWSKVTSEPSGGSHWVSIGLATSFLTDLRLVRSTTILDNIGTVCDII